MASMLPQPEPCSICGKTNCFARESFPNKSDEEAHDLLVLWEGECYEQGQTN